MRYIHIRMKLHEKIAKIRKKKGLKISDLHRKLKSIFGNKALSYRTLLRLEKGHADGRGTSLYQICMGLNITLEELKKGTDEDIFFADYMPKNRRQGKYVYSDKATAFILSGAKRNFLPLELVLEPGAKTKIEKDPDGEVKFEKWVYVLQGELNCVVKDKKIILKKSDCVSFDSRLAHCFENTSSKKTSCIIIQNPTHI